jgi:hypothetical protein
MERPINPAGQLWNRQVQIPGRDSTTAVAAYRYEARQVTVHCHRPAPITEVGPASTNA